jgi:hypothetical protein
MLNNIDLVTVTCERDRGIQQLQSYSISLMLTDPCNHYVIVEDNNVNMETWYNMLIPYYTKHQLHLISGRSLLPLECYANDSRKTNGWHRSAVLKLLAVKKIQSDKYLILDSKNFFVHPQTLNDWPLKDGNGIIDKYDTHGWDEIDKFCSDNRIPIPDNVYNSSTPFIVNTNVVKKIIEFDFLSLFFDKKGWWSSEIFLYSIFTQYAGNKLKTGSTPNLTFWNTERLLTTETLTDCYTWPNMRTFGLHRHIIELGTDLSEFVDFLVGIGFDKNIVENALTQYKQHTTIKTIYK